MTQTFFVFRLPKKVFRRSDDVFNCHAAAKIYRGSVPEEVSHVTRATTNGTLHKLFLLRASKITQLAQWMVMYVIP
ncbi:hypothetical protein M3J09_010919 [Ascochyta lentis]